MAVVNQQWLDQNEQRSYPIDDRATETDDNGKNLPNEIITDMILFYPQNMGGVAYVSNVNVSPLLVTVTVCLATNDPFNAGDVSVPITNPLGVLPIAVAQVNRTKASKGQVFTFTPLIDGVAGWITFGDVNNILGSWNFTGANQSAISPRATRPYEYNGVKKFLINDNTTTFLQHDVKFEGQSAIVTTIEKRNIGTDLAPIIIDALVVKIDPEGENLLELFSGPCARRPDSHNCGKEAITSVAGVKPDDNGTINLTFDPEFVVTILAKDDESDPTGAVIDSLHGLAEICASQKFLPIDDDGNIIDFGDVACNESLSIQENNLLMGFSSVPCNCAQYDSMVLEVYNKDDNVTVNKYDISRVASTSDSVITFELEDIVKVDVSCQGQGWQCYFFFDGAYQISTQYYGYINPNDCLGLNSFLDSDLDKNVEVFLNPEWVVDSNNIVAFEYLVEEIGGGIIDPASGTYVRQKPGYFVKEVNYPVDEKYSLKIPILVDPTADPEKHRWEQHYNNAPVQDRVGMFNLDGSQSVSTITVDGVSYQIVVTPMVSP